MQIKIKIKMMKQYLLLFIIQLTLLKEIQYGFYKILGIYNLKILIGESQLIRYYEIDMTQGISWSSASVHGKNKQAKILSKGIYSFNNNETFPYDLICEPFTLERSESDFFPIKEVCFYYFESPLYSYDSISFAHKIEDTKLSLLYSLYNNKEINKLAFGFGNTNHIGVVYFGGLPLSQLSNKSSVNIPMNKSAVEWKGTFDKVIIGNHEFKQSGNFIFDSRQKNILAPHNFFDFLDTVFFKEYFEKEKCEKIHYSKTQYFYQCYDITIAHNFPELSFVFGNYAIKINNDILFEEKFSRYCFIIEENLGNEYEWVLGTDFISLFDTEFNYENDSVTLYHTTIIQYCNHYINHDKKNIIYLIISFICLSNILILVFVYFTMLQRMNK